MFLKNRRPNPPVYAGKAGERAYAIGDIHGRLDLLIDLLDKIEAHNLSSSDKPAHLIFLGDLIDRGPHSKDVIELLHNRQFERLQPHFIMGNHEESLLRGLSDQPSLIAPWLRHGGYETAESYGVDRGALMGLSDHELVDIMWAAIPRPHLEFMSSFIDSVRFGDILFVHAGLRPGIPFDEQSAKDMRWIRTEFLDSEEDFECLVVHGHTVSETIEEKPNRIGLDTGAYKSGRLSAIWIENEERGYLQSSGPSRNYG